MFSSPERTQRRWRLFCAGLYAAALGVLGVSWPAVSSAHFILQQPPAYSVQDGLGSPQKSAPCGQADPGVPMQPSGMVTTFVQGQTFTLTIDEKVPHPGHYRVLIAADPSSLPADPAVTPGATPCGSTTITTNPTLPLVADGLLPHTAAFNTPQSVQVTLPPNFTCTSCTMQVVQFMSNHQLNNPGGCFYHHCANVSILPAPDAGAADAATPGPADGGVTNPPPPPPEAVGCGCQLGAAPAAAPAVPAAGLLLLGLSARRRRRR